MFEVKPYRGVGTVEFGMTRADVTAVMGEPSSVRQTSLGDTELMYPQCSVRLSGAQGDKGVAEIGFFPDCDVMVAGIDVYGDPSAFDQLARLDGGPLEYAGTVVLLRLGIAMTGFHDANEDQRHVTIFARGRWDRLRDKLEELP